MSRLDVVAIGNALVDVLSHESRRVPRPSSASSPGAMDAHRHRRAPSTSTRRWVPASRSRAGRPRTRSSASRRSAARPRSSAASPTTSSARSTRHDLRAAGVAVRRARPRPTAEPTGRCLIMVTPDARAHDEHLPRRVGRARPRRRRPPTSSRGAQVPYLEGYLWDEPDGARTPTGCAAAHRARGRQPGRAHALRLLLRRPPPRRVPRPGRSPTSTCCSPTKPRSARSTRSTTSTPRSQHVQHHCEIAALDAQRAGLGDRRRATRCT